MKSFFRSYVVPDEFTISSSHIFYLQYAYEDTDYWKLWRCSKCALPALLITSILTMNSESFKPYLVRDKVFLNELYQSSSVPNSKRLLLFASDQKLDTLIKFLHFVSNGEIKLKKEHFDVFSKRQVALMKKKFEKKNLVKQFLKEERKVKITVLQKLAPILPQLLYALFNEN